MTFDIKLARFFQGVKKEFENAVDVQARKKEKWISFLIICKEKLSMFGAVLEIRFNSDF